MMKKTAVLQIKGYTKQFILHEQAKVIPSSQNVHLEVFSGALTALTGPSGSGKSTVLKGIYRTYLATDGQILYTTEAGQVVDLIQADEHQILKLRRTEIGFVTQFLHFLPRQATQDVVSQPLIERGMSVQKARILAREMLAAVNLPECLWGISPATFSGGEKQRVNLARGLVVRSRLLLLDEPTASLDSETSERVVGLIESLKTKDVAMLAIFHQPELIKRMADHVVNLRPPLTNEYPLEEMA
jgi:alpha-D-ribose 1-methylphosphonate 5-triphosphate synthase subunit PhnL